MLSKVDREIIQEIKDKVNIDKLYFTYNNVTKKKGIHSFARYPATMVPEMQKDILKIVLSKTNTKNLLDPFMGSGTVLVEGIKNNLDVYGNDINPYAYYLTKAKLTYLDIDNLLEAKFDIIRKIQDDNYEYKIHYFKNIDKWFREDYQETLSKIRSSIYEVRDIDIRNFMLIVLSDVVTTIKNSQSSTFKLHIKSEDKIQSFSRDALSDFISKLDKNIDSYLLFRAELRRNKVIKRKYLSNPERLRKSVKISCGDSRKLSEVLALKSNSIDLIVTSPPYGDNKTTVTYGQYSTLPLFWMKGDNEINEYDSDLLSDFSAIDTASLGGRINLGKHIEKIDVVKYSKSLNEFYLKMVKYNREDKGRKVVSFIVDFHDVLKEMYKVLKLDGYMVFVVGNRRVHNEIVPFDLIIDELLEKYFVKVTDFDRIIKNKKIASNISNVDEKSVKSINQEKIIIYKKKKLK